MLWIVRFSGFFSAAMVVIVLSPSLQSFPPAEAIRHSSQIDGDPRFLTRIGQIGQSSAVDYPSRFAFRKSQPFRNAEECRRSEMGESSICDPSMVHIAITLDREYLRGSIAAVHSILQHSLCPENIFLHFLVSDTDFEKMVRSTFPELKFKVYYFDPAIVRPLISTSVRQALEQPLNYARNYLAEILEPCVRRVIYPRALALSSSIFILCFPPPVASLLVPTGNLAGYLHPLAILPKWRASSLKLLLCLRGPLYIWDQLGCLVSIVQHQEKSTGFPWGGFACIWGHFGILLVFRVAFGCNLRCLLEISPSRKRTFL